MQQAIVAVEDQRFYEHNGVDMRGIVRAALAGHPQHRPSSRAARRSRSSSSRTPTSATSGRSPARCARPRSPGSSSSAGRRTGSSPPTSTRSTSATAPTGSSRRRGRTSSKGADELTLPEAALLAGHPRRPVALRPDAAPARPRSSGAHYVLRTMFDQGKITARRAAHRANAAPLPKRRGRPAPRHAGAGASTSSTTSRTS